LGQKILFQNEKREFAIQNGSFCQKGVPNATPCPPRFGGTGNKANWQQFWIFANKNEKLPKVGHLTSKCQKFKCEMLDI